VDLKAVRAATGPELVRFAAAAAANARGLLNDAHVLARAGSEARAYSLAALAVEECGKALGLSALALLPDDLRAHAPVRRILGWHQLKQVGGLLIAVVTYDSPGAAARLAAMSATELTEVFSELEAPADEADRLKRRGFYIDMDRHGRIHGPSDIDAAQVASQLARAGRAVSAASALLDPAVQGRLSDPPAVSLELARAVVSTLTEAQDGRTPKAAANVMLTAVRNVQDRLAVDPSD
jgi:AbiV family abortive infection protein